MAFSRFFSPRSHADVHRLPLRPVPTTERTSPSPVQTSGTKRSRCGQPITPPPPSSSPIRHKHASLRYSRSRSSCKDERGLSSIASSSGDDSDVSACSHEEYTLPPDHEFQSLRVDIVLVASANVYAWMACAHYGAPPETTQPPHKRARKISCQPRSTHSEDEQDLADSFVFVPHFDGYYRLSCPYYASNPNKYGPCVLEHDLHSVKAVIDHVRNHHMEPPSCAMCCRVFDRAADRDDHMYKNQCEIRSPEPIDGINLYQSEKLVEHDRSYLSDKKRWYRIWKTVFPNSTPPRSPYLDNGVGLELSMVRDYWARHGFDCVSQYLKKRGMLRQQQEEEEEEGALAALAKLTLQGLLTKAFDEHGQI